MTTDEQERQRWREALAEDPTDPTDSTDPADGGHSSPPGRCDQEPPWRWRTLVENLAPMADRVLDLGTGGGEVLAALADVLPEGSVATEGRTATLALARARLAPLGIEVLEHGPDTGALLPVGDGGFGLVLCHHEPFDATEISRVLAPGGTFLTQQVGGDDGQEIRALFGHDAPRPRASLEDTVHALTVAGLTVERADAFHGRCEIDDVPTLLRALRRAPWGAPEGLDVGRHRDVLEHLHARLRTGPFSATVSRYLVQASIPEPARTGRTDFSQLLDEHPAVPRV
ncbi:class I SAM-dependent methyltransferase [Brachybacterium sp.]|uniref:class I SAM-dependent methyltransferase n=1 Tax=Brachybacterium sp. TaxID=1891286 RepID=UPI002ECFB63C